MATCLSSGLAPSKAVELSSRIGKNQSLLQAGKAASRSIAAGQSIPESLAHFSRHFPSFAFPLIETGAASGQLAEVFERLGGLCRQLAQVAELAWKIVLIPVSILIFGDLLQFAIMISFGDRDGAILSSLSMLWRIVLTSATLWLVLQTRLGQRVCHRGLVSAPYLGSVVRSFFFTFYFQSLKFLYRSGTGEFEAMLRHSETCVGNDYLREDLAKFREGILRGLTISEALEAPQKLPDDLRALLQTGAEAGRFEEALDEATRKQTSALQSQLEFTQLILARILGFAVAMSLVGVVFRYI